VFIFNRFTTNLNLSFKFCCSFPIPNFFENYTIVLEITTSREGQLPININFMPCCKKNANKSGVFLHAALLLVLLTPHDQGETPLLPQTLLR
jgi:hypothetical protein